MNKLSNIRNQPSKAGILIIIFSLFIGILPCDAQSIVGKWKQMSGRMFCTPEAVARSNGHMQAIMQMPKIDAVDEFKSNNTLVETITSGRQTTTKTGKWTMSGKNVTITLTGNAPMGGIYSASDNTLVFTMEMPQNPHMSVTKREWTYARR